MHLRDKRRLSASHGFGYLATTTEYCSVFGDEFACLLFAETGFIMFLSYSRGLVAKMSQFERGVAAQFSWAG